ncbi:MAG: hypothetical protein ACJAXE_001466 [Neolewinella sp.]|jgi:hypothetical protein
MSIPEKYRRYKRELTVNARRKPKRLFIETMKILSASIS